MSEYRWNWEASGCQAHDRCDRPGDEEPYEQYDRYNIYAGRWHELCWERWGYGGFVFDPAYAGERLEEDDP